MIQLFEDLGMCPITTTESSVKLCYFDLVLEDNEKSIHSVIKMKSDIKNVELLTKTIELNKDESHFETAYNFIMTEYVNRIRELCKKWNDDVKEAYTIHEYTDKKMLVKILKASNEIAANGRFGSGNFVISPLKYLNVMQRSKHLKYSNLSKYSLIENFIISEDNDNEVIVGRFPQRGKEQGLNEPGLHLILNEEIWTKNLPYEKDGKDYFDISYSIEEVGTKPYYQYIIVRN